MDDVTGFISKEWQGLLIGSLKAAERTQQTAANHRASGGRFNLMLSLSNGGISCKKTLANAGVFIFFKYQ